MSVNVRVLKLRFVVFPRGPGGVGELREAGRNHFHLSWYLLVSVVTSYGQKPWGNFFVRRRYVRGARDYLGEVSSGRIRRNNKIRTGKLYREKSGGKTTKITPLQEDPKQQELGIGEGFF